EQREVGFEYGKELGVDGFERDVRVRKDQEVMVFDEGSVDRRRKGCGKVSGDRLGELKKLEGGYELKDMNGLRAYGGDGERGIVRLDELLKQYGDMYITVDL
ncbi:glycerophosphodiester phosphodiesterase family protein, partial [Staphylococcus aureus]|uniref:glycerophosphodiester phosphodiesterase family protein n=1 Tax=Staphylococcus aureus TaxID=1280 RepID=UPI0037D9A7E8